MTDTSREAVKQAHEAMTGEPLLWRDGWHALNQENRDLKAKLAKAVNALGQIATDEHPLGWTAIAALAEIKGDSHE